MSVHSYSPSSVAAASSAVGWISEADAGEEPIEALCFIRQVGVVRDPQPDQQRSGVGVDERDPQRQIRLEPEARVSGDAFLGAAELSVERLGSRRGDVRGGLAVDLGLGLVGELATAVRHLRR